MPGAQPDLVNAGLERAGISCGPVPAASNDNTVQSPGPAPPTGENTRKTLERIPRECCPTCNGRGRAGTLKIIRHEIFREILRNVGRRTGDRLRARTAQAAGGLPTGEKADSAMTQPNIINKFTAFAADRRYGRKRRDSVSLQEGRRVRRFR